MSCHCFPCLHRVVAPTLNSTILDCRLDLRIHHWRRHIVFSLLISIRTSYNQVVHCWAGEIPTLQRAEWVSRLQLIVAHPCAVCGDHVIPMCNAAQRKTWKNFMHANSYSNCVPSIVGATSIYGSLERAAIARKRLSRASMVCTFCFHCVASDCHF